MAGRQVQNRGMALSGILTGIITIVVISKIRTDPEISAVLTPLETLIVGFLGVGIAIGMLIQAFKVPQ